MKKLKNIANDEFDYFFLYWLLKKHQTQNCF